MSGFRDQERKVYIAVFNRKDDNKAPRRETRSRHVQSQRESALSGRRRMVLRATMTALCGRGMP